MSNIAYMASLRTSMERLMGAKCWRCWVDGFLSSSVANSPTILGLANLITSFWPRTFILLISREALAASASRALWHVRKCNKFQYVQVHKDFSFEVVIFYTALMVYVSGYKPLSRIRITRFKGPYSLNIVSTS